MKKVSAIKHKEVHQVVNPNILMTRATESAALAEAHTTSMQSYRVSCLNCYSVKQFHCFFRAERQGSIDPLDHAPVAYPTVSAELSERFFVRRSPGLFERELDLRD